MAQPSQAANTQDGDGKKVPSLRHGCQHRSLAHELDGWTLSGTQAKLGRSEKPQETVPESSPGPPQGMTPAIH